MSKVTTIKIKRDTRNALAELGKKDDTFDDIIRELLDFYIKNKVKSKESVKE